MPFQIRTEDNRVVELEDLKTAGDLYPGHEVLAEVKMNEQNGVAYLVEHGKGTPESVNELIVGAPVEPVAAEGDGDGAAPKAGGKKG